MKTSFEIKNPAHKMYNKARLDFEFGKDELLQKISFYIDDKYFYIPMRMVKRPRVSSVWIFQKALGLNPLTAEELKKIVVLTKDVLNIYEMQSPLTKLLEAVEEQAAVYSLMVNSANNKEQKSAYHRMLNTKNALIINVNKFRGAYVKRLPTPQELNISSTK